MMIFLRAVVQHGTGAAAAQLKHPLGGKTGTTSDYTDAWFLGFSPSVTCGVWVGYDSRQSLGEKETGAKAALPIWMTVIKAAIAGKDDEQFMGDQETPADAKNQPPQTAKPLQAAQPPAQPAPANAAAKPASAGATSRPASVNSAQTSAPPAASAPGAKPPAPPTAKPAAKPSPQPPAANPPAKPASTPSVKPALPPQGAGALSPAR
jgi:penicillin-binding protein 1A